MKVLRPHVPHSPTQRTGIVNIYAQTYCMNRDGVLFQQLYRTIPSYIQWYSHSFLVAGIISLFLEYHA